MFAFMGLKSTSFDARVTVVVIGMANPSHQLTVKTQPALKNSQRSSVHVTLYVGGRNVSCEHASELAMNAQIGVSINSESCRI